MRRGSSILRSGLLLASAAASAACSSPDQRERLVLGTTHTLQDSGLLDELGRLFSAAHPEYRLSVVVAGSGETLALARRGDFDVVLTHSPEDEAAFLAAGHGESRHPVMHNHFLLLGPPDDPAGAAGAAGVREALIRIEAAGAGFVSRGDDSGTHRRERALWADAGLLPDWNGYIEAGASMADVLRLAAQRRAYTLADLATWEVLRHELQLRAISDADVSELRNPYSVIVAAAARSPDGARAFSRWVREPQAQSLIGGFGRAADGRTLFTPANPAPAPEP
jgi:tungstate transport system substrate-binding protein